MTQWSPPGQFGDPPLSVTTPSGAAIPQTDALRLGPRIAATVNAHQIGAGAWVFVVGATAAGPQFAGHLFAGQVNDLSFVGSNGPSALAARVSWTDLTALALSGQLFQPDTPIAATATQIPGFDVAVALMLPDRSTLGVVLHQGVSGQPINLGWSLAQAPVQDDQGNNPLNPLVGATAIAMASPAPVTFQDPCFNSGFCNLPLPNGGADWINVVDGGNGTVYVGQLRWWGNNAPIIAGFGWLHSFPSFQNSFYPADTTSESITSARIDSGEVLYVDGMDGMGDQRIFATTITVTPHSQTPIVTPWLGPFTFGNNLACNFVGTPAALWLPGNGGTQHGVFGWCDGGGAMLPESPIDWIYTVGQVPGPPSQIPTDF